MADLETAYIEFMEDLRNEAYATGEPFSSVFFDRYSKAATENGDCLDLFYTPARKEGAKGYQIDGYAIDITNGELYLAICDFHDEEETESLNRQQITSLCGRVERFLTVATNPAFINSLEEASPDFEAAYPIYERFAAIRRIRIIIFSNARLVAQKKVLESKESAGKTLVYNVLDFSRYTELQKPEQEPVEIDFTEYCGSPLPCLPAHTGSSGYESYLIAISGASLAKIYGLYGPRLMEQNVRTFLQARTKVNQGIITTIEKNPDMFFAYNNGITATASAVEHEVLPGGVLAIRKISNLQIVNGGQTTASILYAKDIKGLSLENVFVQLKLSVLAPEGIDEIVSKIARFANTQNKVSEADFFSTHPFHVELERISRRLAAPARDGSLVSTKWFYERARGQYKTYLSRLKGAERAKAEAMFPASQLIDKTDLAKYMLSYDCLPHIVSQGAQKCFMNFAAKVGEVWKDKPEAFNDGYFKASVAKAILFRWTDHMVAGSGWYKEDRGYKSQIVTYTVAWLVNHLKNKQAHIDLEKVWNRQELPDEIKCSLETAAPYIAARLKDTPANLRNVAEFCKNQACWSAVSELRINLTSGVTASCIDSREVRQRERENLAVGTLDIELNFETMLFTLIPVIAEIREFAEGHNLMSPVGSAALLKISRGNVNLVAAEKQTLKQIFKRMQEIGFDFPQKPRV
ncbi:MAG: AIPR family protein [Desulfuromonadaceae bacterium]